MWELQIYRLLEELEATHAHGIWSTSEDEGIEVGCLFDLIADSLESLWKAFNLATKGRRLTTSNTMQMRTYFLMYCLSKLMSN